MGCCPKFREQFTVSNFDCNSAWPRRFVEPSCLRVSWFYAIYRVLVAAYFVAVLIYVAYEYEYGAMWLIYLEHWCHLALLTDVCIQAWLSVSHCYYVTTNHVTPDEKMYDRTPCLFKLVWTLHNICLDLYPLVTLTYCLERFPKIDDPASEFLEIHVNMVGTGYLLLDFLVSGIPVRLLHVYHAMVFGGVYVAFTVAFWYAGMTTPTGKRFIYRVLRYSAEPLDAVFYVLMFLLLLVPAVHLLWYWIQAIKRTCSHDFEPPKEEKGEASRLVEE